MIATFQPAFAQGGRKRHTRLPGADDDRVVVLVCWHGASQGMKISEQNACFIVNPGLDSVCELVSLHGNDMPARHQASASSMLSASNVRPAKRSATGSSKRADGVCSSQASQPGRSCRWIHGQQLAAGVLEQAHHPAVTPQQQPAARTEMRPGQFAQAVNGGQAWPHPEYPTYRGRSCQSARPCCWPDTPRYQPSAPPEAHPAPPAAPARPIRERSGCAR